MASTTPTITTTTAPPADQPPTAQPPMSLPPPIATTPRCIIRPYAATDAPSTAAAANSPAVARYMTLAFPQPYTLASAEAWIALNQTPPIHNFAITPFSAPATVIGGIGLKPGADVQAHTAEIGYWLGEAWWGRGIMTEVLGAVTGWVMRERPGIRRLWAVVCGGNVGSEKALERCGYRFEGCMREHYVKDDVVGDIMLWGITRGDWEEREREREGGGERVQRGGGVVLV